MSGGEGVLSVRVQQSAGALSCLSVPALMVQTGWLLAKTTATTSYNSYSMYSQVLISNGQNIYGHQDTPTTPLSTVKPLIRTPLLYCTIYSKT